MILTVRNKTFNILFLIFPTRIHNMFMLKHFVRMAPFRKKLALQLLQDSLIGFFNMISLDM